MTGAEHVVRVLPADADLVVRESDDIFWAARRAGWQWPTTCDGNGECGQCFVIVEDGAEHLAPISPPERELLAEGIVARNPRARLACMTFVTGPAVVRRAGARPPATSSRR
jgi:ferredoxin